MLLELKYLEAYPDGNRLCTSGEAKDGPFLQELETKGIFLSKQSTLAWGRSNVSVLDSVHRAIFTKKRSLYKYKFTYQILPEFREKKEELHLLLCHFCAVSRRANSGFRL